MYELIIIGAGPAGLTAGIYAGRYRLNTLILEKMTPGGQIMLSSRIENYPGFPGGIATQELIDRFKKQVDDLGVNFADEEVQTISASVQLKRPLYHIQGRDKNYETQSVIIATGAAAKRLGVAGEERLTGRGVSYCATCDAPLYRDKEVLVIGGGDRALEEVIFLSSYAAKVTLVHRRNQLRASKILEERARANPKINFILDSVIAEIIGKDRVEAVSIKNVLTAQAVNLSCQGVFIFVGIQPHTDFLKKLLQLDEAGFIITDENLATSQEGIFACGDCRKKNLYQVINACAEGAVAAYSAHKYILNQ
ncbi:MAG: thioredoxin-disulfide reductase [Candidatus Omnitrophica bacterium]|nr:thioredoxin-disulfide reductase [Candidatus Omnitrophota bacterium]